MKTNYNRRKFIHKSSLAAVGITLTSSLSPVVASAHKPVGNRIGIIGLDTSHSVAFTKSLNSPDADQKYKGFKIVAAYPNGSADIESSVKRIPGYIEDVKKLGVEIVSSIDELLKKVDFVLLETNDGRPHLEQAFQVMKAGKPLFVDKPVAASLSDVIAMYSLSASTKVPFFSSSSLRYMETAQEVAAGKIGAVLGADCFSPATLEKTHPDLFWYGIHGVEILYTVMGTGCTELSRTSTENADIVVGTWKDGRIGTFRGTRNGKHDYGGTAYGEKGNMVLGPFKGYDNLLDHIIAFFSTGNIQVNPTESIEIYTFMEAADESKRQGGKSVKLEDIKQKHIRLAEQKLKKLNPLP